MNRIYTLAHHEEFTRYAVQVMLKSSASVTGQQVWDLFMKLEGIGKVYAWKLVEKLAPSYYEKLRYINWPDKLYDYYPAAEMANYIGLHAILSQSFINQEQYKEARQLLTRLFCPYVHDKCSSYTDALHAMIHYVRHSKMHARTIHDLYPIVAMQLLLREEERVWASFYMDFWNPEQRAELDKLIPSFLQRTYWRQIVEEQIMTIELPFRVAFIQFYELPFAKRALKNLEDDTLNIPLIDIAHASQNEALIERVGHLLVTTIGAEFQSKPQIFAFIAHINKLKYFDGVGLSALRFALRQQRTDIQWLALHILKHWSDEQLRKPQVYMLLDSLAQTSSEASIIRSTDEILKRIK